MGNSAASAARMTGAADAGRRRRVISGAGATAVAGAVLAARRARRTRRVTAYVVSGRIGVPGVVTPIRTATNTAGPPITVPLAQSIAITPDGKTVYVPNATNPAVTPIRTATNTAGPPIPVGNSPFGIVITPNGKTAYVTNPDDGTVTPIRTATNTAGPPIPVGNNPIRLAVTPDGKAVYVLNFDDGTVTPIRTASNTAGASPKLHSSSETGQILECRTAMSVAPYQRPNKTQVLFPAFRCFPEAGSRDRLIVALSAQA